MSRPPVRVRAKAKAGANKFLVSQDLFPQTIELLKTRANPLDIDLVISHHSKFELTEKVFGVIVQYPNQ